MNRRNEDDRNFLDTESVVLDGTTIGIEWHTDNVDNK